MFEIIKECLHVRGVYGVTARSLSEIAYIFGKLKTPRHHRRRLGNVGTRYLPGRPVLVVSTVRTKGKRKLTLGVIDSFQGG